MLPEGEVGTKIKRYEDFLELKLKPQLLEYTKARDAILVELGQYLQLKSTIEMIREQKLKNYNARVDVGQEFFMEAETKDLDKIMVKVSREYFVELSQEEALQYVSKREKMMNSQVDQLQ